MTREPTALHRAAELIVSGIREGRYAPGQRLIEADLIVELDVSRSSVREALRRLEAQGLVEMVPHRGARVRRITADDVREIFEVRAAIESEAARLAALRIDRPGHRARLEERVTANRAAALQPAVIEYLDENTRFHEALLRLSSNGHLAELLDAVRLQTVRFILPPYLRSPVVAVRRSLAEHERIAECILTGDADGAARAMPAHIEASA